MAVAVNPGGAVTPNAAAGHMAPRRPSASHAAGKGRRTTVISRSGPRGRQRRKPFRAIGSALRVGGELQAVGEILEPLLRRPEEKLRLLRVQRVPVQRMLDDVARSAMELVREQRDLAVGPGRPGLGYGDFPVGRTVVR